MKVGILTIATGKYDRFVVPLWESVKKYFFADNQNEVTMYVHTDKIHISETARNHHLVCLEQAHLGWPFSTLYRYRIFNRNTELFLKQDYLFYLDIDMKVINPVGSEILSDKLTAVLHPGFCIEGHAAYPHEKRPTSLAYVAPEMRTAYYCGGVQGGKATVYLGACLGLSNDIDKDLDSGIVAEFHDESHWNRYLAYNPENLTKVLDSSYCIPEEFRANHPNAKILALLKNHAEIRS